MRFKKDVLLPLLALGAFLALSAPLWATGSIAGRVATERDSVIVPVVGAEVTAVSSDWRVWKTARTDSGGNYQIDDLRAGDYRVEACARDLGCLFFPGTRERDSAQLVAVVDGDTTSGIDFLFPSFAPPPSPSPGLITGRITNAATGEGIAGARVKARPIGHWESFKTETGPDGSYQLSVPPGDFDVFASASDFESGVFAGNPVHVDSGDTVEGIDIALSPEGADDGSISGQVTNAADGSPIEDAFVFARRIDRCGFEDTRTDSMGNYKIEELRPGFYKMGTFAEGFFPAVFPDPVEVLAGMETPNINLALQPETPPDSGTISGMVTVDDSTGLPIEEAVVAAVGFDSSRHHLIIRFAHTDSSGAYELTGLPKIPFILIAAARGFFAEIFDNVQRFEDATLVTPDASGINFALARRDSSGHAVSGIVQSNMAGPLPGALVSISLSAGGPVAGTAVTLPDGGFIIEGLDPGVYILAATTEQGSVSQSIDLSGGSLAGVSLTLPASTVLRGDINGDGSYQPSDVVMLLNGVFIDPSTLPDRAAADLNCDGDLTPSDVVAELQLVFLGQSAAVCGF